MKILLLLLILVLPKPGIIEDSVDYIEDNYYYGTDNLIFHQYIFWDSKQGGPTANARGFVLAHTEPDDCRRVVNAEKDRITYIDDDKNIRRIYGPVIQTCTDIDPEVDDRLNLPMQYRRPLSKPKVKKLDWTERTVFIPTGIIPD